MRAGMISHPADYRRSSASAHISGKDDGLVRVRPLLEIEPNWVKFMSADGDGEELETVRRRLPRSRNRTFSLLYTDDGGGFGANLLRMLRLEWTRPNRLDHLLAQLPQSARGSLRGRRLRYSGGMALEKVPAADLFYLG